MRRILVVEDENALAEVLAVNLEREGFEVLVARDGEDGLRQAQVKLPDLVTLDLLLPRKPGLEVCRLLRASEPTRMTPIVMLTAHSDETAERIGLTVGADDYVRKPFSVNVLIERIKTLLRWHSERAAFLPGLLIECRGVVIDPHRHRAYWQGHELGLMPTEYRFLEKLLRNPGLTLTRHELLGAAFGANTKGFEGLIDLLAENLRRKLGSGAELVESLPGFRYRFREGNGAAPCRSQEPQGAWQS